MKLKRNVMNCTLYKQSNINIEIKTKKITHLADFWTRILKNLYKSYISIIRNINKCDNQNEIIVFLQTHVFNIELLQICLEFNTNVLKLSFLYVHSVLFRFFFVAYKEQNNIFFLFASYIEFFSIDHFPEDIFKVIN